MKQITFAATGFELVTKGTRKRQFLKEMVLVVLRTELLALNKTETVGDLVEQLE